MPLLVHPLLRSLQEAQELDGWIKPLDSVLVTNFKAQEAQGLKQKVVPIHTVYLSHTTFVPK